MKILSIETSCDETAVAVVEADEKSGDFDVLSNVVSSQIKIHAKWGGVVPNLAAREHLKNIVPVLDESLKNAKMNLQEIDLISVVEGPGLIPALLLGTNAAKSLAYFCEKPLMGIHHIEGHICSNYIEAEDNKKEKKYFGRLDKFKFPILCLVISGGHTQLVLMEDYLKYKIIGQTQDDAVGEAFDKVAKIIGLGYPGGPIVSKMADEAGLLLESGENNFEQFLEIKFPRPMLKNKNLEFSFSGLKTAVLYFWKDVNKKTKKKKELDLWRKFICLEFERAVSEVFCQKSSKAIEEFNPQTFLLAGGVAANKRLREDLKKVAEGSGIEFSCPLLELCGDNAAMIAVATIMRNKFGKNGDVKNNWKDLEASAQMELE